MDYTPVKSDASSSPSVTLTSEAQKLEVKVKSAKLPRELFDKALDQIKRAKFSLQYGTGFNQLEVVSRYIDWICALPWDAKTSDQLDIEKALQVMDKNHHGLGTIKKRVLEYLSILKLQDKESDITFHAPTLLFVGLAGTGKTTFAMSIAQTLGRKFARIPFGGLSSPLDLRGMSKVQPEAEPGAIIKALRRVGSRNPVILLDELDRVAPEAHGAIMGVLVELMDPEQNANFIDHYIDFPFDLSQIMFIATANNTKNIPTALMDRLEIVQMPSYSDQDKIAIAKDYILPRLLRESGLPQDALTVEDAVWQKIARMSGYDPGIRSVQRKAKTMVRRAAYKVVRGEGTKFAITEGNVKEYID